MILLASEGEKPISIDFRPSAHKTPESAAKAFYEALIPVVTAYGQSPEHELFILTPEEASKREYGNCWVVSWEAGPYRWGINMSLGGMWNRNGDNGGWFTEPYYSFDLCFQWA